MTVERYILILSGEAITANSQNASKDTGSIEVELYRVKNVVSSRDLHQGFKPPQRSVSEKQIKGQALSLKSQ
jgi:hypothetical protein